MDDQILITDDDHKALLEQLSRLPFGNRQAIIYKKSLVELHAQYHALIDNLGDTAKAYHEVAELIKQRQPLSNRKQYARIRRRRTNENRYKQLTEI